MPLRYQALTLGGGDIKQGATNFTESEWYKPSFQNTILLNRSQQ